MGVTWFRRGRSGLGCDV